MEHNRFIGYWMGSFYTPSGDRRDEELVFSPSGRYRRRQDGVEDAGAWEYDDHQKTLRLAPEGTTDQGTSGYWVMTVNGAENAETILVLRAAIIAARNLPVLFYRVHRPCEV